MNPLLAKALGHVEEIHKDDKYGENPYMYHINNVYRRVALGAFHVPDEILIKVCILALYHDAYEDHSNKVNLDWFAMTYGEDLKNSLLAISFNKGHETREEYYQRVEKDYYASFVKYHDAKENAFNCYVEGNTEREKYYQAIVERFENCALNVYSPS